VPRPHYHRQTSLGATHVDRAKRKGAVLTFCFFGLTFADEVRDFGAWQQVRPDFKFDVVGVD
jgi:hypothetical protein